MVLDEEVGLCIFNHHAGFRGGEEPKQSVPASIIGKALRSTGQSWHEYGIQIHLVPTAAMLEAGEDDTMIEVRASSYGEMVRWLAALNLKGAEWHPNRKQQAIRSPKVRANKMPSHPEIEDHHISTAMSSTVTGIDGQIGEENEARPWLQRKTTEGGRRYSSVHKVCALVTPLTTVEIASCFFTIKKTHGLGSKKRYCKLLGSRTQDAKPGSFEKVSLVVLHHATDANELGQVMNVADITEVNLVRQTCIVLKVEQHTIRMVTSEGAAAQWAEAIRIHGERMRLMAKAVKVSGDI